MTGEILPFSFVSFYFKIDQQKTSVAFLIIPVSGRYSRIFLSISCLDVDECHASVPVCDVNAKCINIISSFTCACKTGFSGDGFSCSGKNISPYFLE